MSDGSPVDDLDLERPLNNVGRQAADSIESDTDWAELGSKLDVSLYHRDDPYPEWHAETTDFDPMFKAVLWAETEDESMYGLSDRLENNPEIGEAFGFEPEEIPCGDTFNNTWNDRFEELQDEIGTTAGMIGEIAHERGCPIGTVGLTPEETGGTSKRTEQRLLRKKTKEVLDEMWEVVFPALNLPRPEKAIYEEEDLLELLTVMGIKGEAANNGASINSDRLAAIKDIDPENDPFYKDGMTGETLLSAIHQLTVHEITRMVNQATKRMLKRIEPYAEFPDPVFMAIDMTYVAYCGEREGLKWVTGAPDTKEYRWCHKFATATLVGDGIHTVVAMLPVGNPEFADNEAYPGSEEKSYICGDVVRKLLDKVPNSINPRCVYADREFATADVMTAFETHNMRYLMPAPRNDRSKRWLRRNVDMEQGILAVKDNWTVTGPVKGGVTNEQVTTTIIGIPGDLSDDQYGFGSTTDDDEEIDNEDKAPVPFYTNLDVSDELGVDRRQTKRQVLKYNQRGGIETSYKKIKEFASYTTSRAFEIRNFHFGFAVLLYNAWLIVDFLVQVGLNNEFRSKPRITASRFLGFLNRKGLGLF